MTVFRQDPPWRVVRGFTNEQQDCLVHLHNLSGGILGGDQFDLEVTLGEGARVLLTSTGATRIYRHRDGRSVASCSTRALVSRNAILEYLPDQLIPYRDSRFVQNTQIELHPESAGLFWWETITSGRTASGESFFYDSLSVNTTVSCDRRPIAIDQFTLEPGIKPLQVPGIFGDFSCCSTFYICKTGVDKKQWAVLLSLLEDDIEGNACAAVRWGASSLVDHGIAIRGLGNESSDLQNGLNRFWKLTKLFLYNSQALRPRKVY